MERHAHSIASSCSRHLRKVVSKSLLASRKDARGSSRTSFTERLRANIAVCLESLFLPRLLRMWKAIAGTSDGPVREVFRAKKVAILASIFESGVLNSLLV